jgi:hypothetical protein
METALLGGKGLGFNTFRYMLRQAAFGALPVTMLPSEYSAAVGLPAHARRTICEFRRLRGGRVEGLLKACRRRGVTATAALAAAMLLTASDFAHDSRDEDEHVYRFLLSLNMRAFAPQGEGQVRSGLHHADVGRTAQLAAPMGGSLILSPLF